MSKNIYCNNCNKTLTGKYQVKYCSHSCAAKVNNKVTKKKEPFLCKFCEKPVLDSRGHRVNRNYHKKCFPKQDYNTFRKKKNQIWWKYEMKKKKQTPSDADLQLIKEIYLNCPDGYEVDHIKPISKGGLHHQDNLQYLTIKENRKKSNKWSE